MIVPILGYFVFVFLFLLLAIFIYVLLAKTKAIGGGQKPMIFVSFVLALFFVIRISFFEFVEFGNLWFGILVIGLFFLLVVFAFLPGNKPFSFLSISNWFSWVVLWIIIILFIALIIPWKII